MSACTESADRQGRLADPVCVGGSQQRHHVLTTSQPDYPLFSAESEPPPEPPLSKGVSFHGDTASFLHGNLKSPKTKLSSGMSHLWPVGGTLWLTLGPGTDEQLMQT